MLRFRSDMMPNWCSNELYIKADIKTIKELATGMKNGSLFNSIIPIPLALKNIPTNAISSDKQMQNLYKERIAYNLENYGYKDWFDFSVANWGTKWDVQENVEFEIFDEDGKVLDYEQLLEEANTAIVDKNMKTFSLYSVFDTAWNPPIGVYEKLSSMPGVKVEAYFYEPGMAFVGEFSSETGDHYYDIPDSAEDAAWSIPKHLDEIFAITEIMDFNEQMHYGDNPPQP